MAERESRWKVEAAAAREEAFRDGGVLRLSEVSALELPESLVHLGIAFDDRLIVVSTAADPEHTFAGRDETPGFASFPHSAASETYSIDVQLIQTHGPMEVRRVDRVPVAHPFVQATPEGGLLIVGARARWVDGEGERNAWIVGDDGSFQHSFCAGDGIQNVQATASGRVWVGYFDEGVFGNFGWGRDGAPSPLGQAGLVCWTSSGERGFAFDPPEGFGPIDDCYAMSVRGEEVWICYYSDFPVVRIGEDFEVDGWSCGVGGAHTIAANSGRVALVGGYRGLHDRIVFIETQPGDTSEPSVYRLAMPDGTELASSARCVARGRYVNVLVEGHWFRLDLDELELP